MKNGYSETDAVILNTIDYGDSDRIVTFYTDEFGKLSGIAKGAKRSRKRFVGNLDPLCHVKFMFFNNPKKDLLRLDDAVLLEGFNSIRSDIDRLAVGSYFIELLNEMSAEAHRNSKVFGLLLHYLKILNSADFLIDGLKKEILLRAFEVKLLAFLGYMPNLDCCVTCRESYAVSDRIFFSSTIGGIVCKSCVPSAGSVIAITKESAAFLNKILKNGASDVVSGEVSPTVARESEKSLHDFIVHHIGKELKTKKFMAKIATSIL